MKAYGVVTVAVMLQTIVVNDWNKGTQVLDCFANVIIISLFLSKIIATYFIKTVLN